MMIAQGRILTMDGRGELELITNLEARRLQTGGQDSVQYRGFKVYLLPHDSEPRSFKYVD